MRFRRFKPALVLWAVLLSGQQPSFEVATIKPNNSGSGRSGYPGIRNGMMTGENISLKVLLRAAYGLSEMRIFGPAWLDDDRFDVTGKLPPGATETEFMPMLQSLLKERFQVTIHREMKAMDVYEMVIAKGGVKMPVFDPSQAFVQPPNRGGAMIIGSGTMAQLAERITQSAGRPILDKTGLEGRYVFTMAFTPVGALSDGSGPPDIFTAMQQTLGLRLDAKKEPVEVLVVDHAERVPSGN